MSDSTRPHRQQPTRLRHPWDSPGKNTGVGCHFLLQRMKMKSESEVTQSCPTLHDPMDCSLPGSSIHGIFQARVLEWGAIAFSGMSLGKCKSKPHERKKNKKQKNHMRYQSYPLGYVEFKKREKRQILLKYIGQCFLEKQTKYDT